MGVKHRDIKVWYLFKPEVQFWFSKIRGKTFLNKEIEETWYGGDFFQNGFFIFLQLYFFAIHIKVNWWKLKT